MTDIAFYHNNQGLCYYHLARDKLEDEAILRQSIAEFNKAIYADELNPIHYLNRGNVFINMRKYEPAKADFDRAIELDPTNAKFYHAKGLTCQTEADSTNNQKR